MHEFERSILGQIERHGLLPLPVGGGGAVRVVVAVSGGADSVALLVALSRLGYECIGAHCNFHLRGEESNRDMQHVAALCGQLGIDLSIKHFNTLEYAQAQGLSVEMAARALRYAWFDDQVDRHKAAAVAVAHHSDDNVETFFLNLLRGSGIAGLCGMPRRRGIVVRPMLECTRAQAEGYLRDLGIAWVDDSTNAANDYRRNRLRNIVLPTLEGAFPGARASIVEAMDHLSAARRLYEQAVAERQALYYDRDGGRYALERLAGAEPEAATLLYEWLRPLGFNGSQCRDILASRHRTGRQFVAESDGACTTAIIDRGWLLLQTSAHPAVAAEADQYVVDLSRDILTPVHITVTRHRVGDFRAVRDSALAFFDARILEGSPTFVLRRWQRGDRLRPYGMPAGQSRLLSDLYSDAHYSLLQKRQAWVLTRNGEILWAVGLRAAANFAITPETRQYLRLNLR